MVRDHRLALRFSVYLILGVVSFLVAASHSWGAEADRIGVVLAVDGTAEVKSPSVSDWGVLKFRDHLFLHDTIRTAASSKVKILMRNDSIMTLAENSEMHLTEFLLNDSQHRSIISLITGKIRVITTKIFGRRDAMEVRTPNTTAGIRGSEEHVSYDEVTNRTEVFCVEGYCYVHPNNDPSQHLRIPVGHIVQHDGLQFPSVTREATVEERRSAANRVQLTEHDPREITSPTGPHGDRPRPPRTRPDRPEPPKQIDRHRPSGHEGEEPPGHQGPGGHGKSVGGPHHPGHNGLLGSQPPPLPLPLPLPPPLPPSHGGELGLGGWAPPGPGTGGPGPELITPDTSPARPQSLIRLIITLPQPPSTP